MRPTTVVGPLINAEFAEREGEIIAILHPRDGSPFEIHVDEETAHIFEYLADGVEAHYREGEEP